MSDTKQILEMLEKQGKAVVVAQKLNDEGLKRSEAAAQEATEEVKKVAIDFASKADAMQGKLDAQQKTIDYMAKSAARGGATADDVADKEFEAKAKDEMSRYMRTKQPLSDDVVERIARDMCKKSFHGVSEAEVENEVKTLISGNNPTAGYFFRPERSASMMTREFETSPMRRIANMETTSSDTFEIIIDDDESTSGGWVGEVQIRASGTGTAEIGKLTIPIHEQFASPRITVKTLNNGGFDTESWLSRKTIDIMTRTENTAFIVGDGSQKPVGIASLPAWTVNGTYERGAIEQIASGNATALTGDGVKDLQNAVIEFYQPGAVFLTKRKTWGDIITLKDGQGNYLLDTRSFKVGDTMSLLGKEVIFMDDLAEVGATNLPLAYGNFSMGYTIVDQAGFRVIRDEISDKRFVEFYTTKFTGAAPSNYESYKLQVISA